MADVFNPDQWLTSLVDALQDYVEAQIDAMIGGNGLEIYDVVMEYPASVDEAFEVPFVKTIIHFEIDEVENRRLGFGSQITTDVITEGTESVAGTWTGYEAMEHRINFDVGVWATDSTGGAADRLRAYEMLARIFAGEAAREKFRADTGGIEIINFNGGRMVKEAINDVRVYRTVGTELEVRVYSRTVAGTEILVDEIVQAPELVIDENVALIDD